MSDQMDDDQNLPEDFFDDLADENLTDDVVENRLDDEPDPQMARCLAEIEKLSKHIAKRKERIQTKAYRLETASTLSSESKRSRSKSRDRHARGSHRSRKNKSKSRSRSPKRGEQHSSRNREEIEERIRRREKKGRSPDRRKHDSRKSRSRSPNPRRKRSSSTHKNLSFLEELAETFKKQGKAFPEGEILLNKDATSSSALANQPDNRMHLGPIGGMPFGLPHQQPVLNPASFMAQQQVAYPLPQAHNLNAFYGMNSMNILAGQVLGAPMQRPIEPTYPMVNRPNEVINKNIPAPQQPQQPKLSDDQVHENNKKALIGRCEQAIKLIRAKDNKVPVMKFWFNRTSVLSARSKESQNESTEQTPLQQQHSALNVAFLLNAQPNEPFNGVNGLKMLPKRVKAVASALGISSSYLFERMHTKEINAQITGELLSKSDGNDKSKTAPVPVVPIQTAKPPVIETATIETQTDELKCRPCIERNSRIMINSHTQIFLPKGISIGVQTNEKDYREPIVAMLSRMSAAQLVAVKDFANIIAEPRPQNFLEMSKVRERMMDIYNLSQRDADAVRTAEENRLDDLQYHEQLRYRGSASDGFIDSTSRDAFDQNSNSSRYVANGSISNFGRNIDNSGFNGDRHMMDDREEDLRRIAMEEEEHIRMIEQQRQREMELEVEQRLFEQRQQEQRERDRMDRDREHQLRQFAAMQQMERDFNRPQNNFNNSSNTNNNNMDRNINMRRNRGVFRGGRGGRR